MSNRRYTPELKDEALRRADEPGVTDAIVKKHEFRMTKGEPRFYKSSHYA